MFLKTLSKMRVSPRDQSTDVDLTNDPGMSAATVAGDIRFLTLPESSPFGLSREVYVYVW
jgi:hypothetical protein